MAQNYQYQQIPAQDPENFRKPQGYSPNPAQTVEYSNPPRQPIQSKNLPYVPEDPHAGQPQHTPDTGANPSQYQQANPSQQPPQQGPDFQQQVGVVYGQARDAVQALPENAHIKGTQKKVCNPALVAMEKSITNAPASRHDCLVFRYELSMHDYEVNNYAPYKANGVATEDIMNAISSLRTIENFDVSEIIPEKKIVWIASIAAVAMICCAIAVSFYVPWIFAIVVNCLMLIPSGMMIVGAVKKQRKNVMDKMDKRCKEISQVLENFNNEYFRGKGLNWKAGDLAAWLELGVSKTSYNF
jgi:hypothetical protein